MEQVRLFSLEVKNVDDLISQSKLVCVNLQFTQCV